MFWKIAFCFCDERVEDCVLYWENWRWTGDGGDVTIGFDAGAGAMILNCQLID